MAIKGNNFINETIVTGLRQRISQGLRPHVSIKAFVWKAHYRVSLAYRNEGEEIWEMFASTIEPLKAAAEGSRQWDATALELWQEALSGLEPRTHQAIYLLKDAQALKPRHAYLSQHLSHFMYYHEVEVLHVARKKDL